MSANKPGEFCYRNDDGTYSDDWIHAEILGDETLMRDYDPNQPRDPKGSSTGGQWTKAGASGHPGEGYSEHAKIINGVIHTTEVEDAVLALHEDRKVELDQPRGVSVVLDKLANRAEDMIKKGQKAPNINLCNLSVRGTNLFCVDHKGIPRIKMPQMDEKQTEKFKEFLVGKGYKISNEEQFASHMRATQNELNGAKVAGIARSLREKSFEAPRMVVSNDDYILDGHHRWAAKIGNDSRDGILTNDTKMKISRVNISVTKLLEEAEIFTGGKGRKGIGDYDPNQPRHPKGTAEISASGERAGGKFARQPLAGSNGHPSLVSARHITAKKSKENSERDLKTIGVESMTEDELKTNTDLFKNKKHYPNLRPEDLKGKTPEEIARAMIDHVRGNLVFLWNGMNPAIRDRARKWYEGANKLVMEQAAKYGLAPAAVAGVYASLSPQQDWYKNVRLGDALMEIYANEQNTPWSKEMTAKVGEIWKAKDRELIDSISGKTLGELEHPVQKAAWIRTFDEAHNDRGFNILSPEGDRLGLKKTKGGKDWNAGWGSLSHISNAVVSLESGGDRRIISDILGDKHKVRSFYNNMLDPWSMNGDVTIDTHAVAAGLLRPLSGTGVPVQQSLGSESKGIPNSSGSAVTGVQGTYGIYATAYREAAAEIGVLPRELQSVTWEAVRGWYPDTWKRGDANQKSVTKIWNDYYKGTTTIEETRKRLYDNAVRLNPSWYF